MLYPIYLDTKQPQQDGARRVSKQVGLEWPLAEQMAKCCRMFGFETVFEVSHYLGLRLAGGPEADEMGIVIPRVSL